MSDEYSDSKPTGAGNAAADPGFERTLDEVRRAIRARHYSPRTEKAYLLWLRRYAVFFRRDPAKMTSAEAKEFLSSLASKRRISASTQTQALSALVFLYREVLGGHSRASTESSAPASPSACPSC